MTQYAIIWRPDLTHLVRAIGPFRKLQTALDVRNEFDAVEESLDIIAGFDDDEMPLMPQVVAFESWADVKVELLKKYGAS